MMAARVVRLGGARNPDNAYFQLRCDACGWRGAMYSNHTIEGCELADRDAPRHVC